MCVLVLDRIREQTTALVHNAHGFASLSWLLNVPATCKVYLGDGSVWHFVRAATLRQKLEITIALSPRYSILTSGQPEFCTSSHSETEVGNQIFRLNSYSIVKTGQPGAWQGIHYMYRTNLSVTCLTSLPSSMQMSSSSALLSIPSPLLSSPPPSSS